MNATQRPLLTEQGELVRLRHLSDLNTLDVIVQAAALSGRVPKRKVKAVLGLIDGERARLEKELAPVTTE